MTFQAFTDDIDAGWAERVLGCQEMPTEEIDAILTTDDPEIVRRYMELHRERLEEHLADRFRELDAIESQLLAGRLATSGD
jgi:hypothetical protein